jgi:uncharacterized protein
MTDFQPGAPSWADLGTTDVQAAAEFYGALFGWTREDLGPQAGGYGFFRKDGLQVAGVGPATDPVRGTSWSVYFTTADAAATATAVKANGGTVLVEPMDVMGQGRMAVFCDPTGAHFSVWQPGSHRGAELAFRPDSMCWAELMSPDMAAAKTFYSAVLGVSPRDIGVPGGKTYTLLEIDGKSVAGAMEVGADQGMPPRWSVYFGVEDCDVIADRALALGGSELMRDDSPAGRLAFLTDPQGGGFCIIKGNQDFAM